MLCCSIIILMRVHTETGEGFLEFVLWLLWVAVATTILGGVVYLFVGGSSFFSGYNTRPIVLYSHINNDRLSLSGSILSSDPCALLVVDTLGTRKHYDIAITTVQDTNCTTPSTGTDSLRSFFVEVAGDSTTTLSVFVDGVKRSIIVK